MDWVRAQCAALGGDDFSAAVLALVALVTVATAAWAVIVVSLATIPPCRGLAIALTPRLLRGALFVGVTSALAVPAAHAEERGVDGLRLPDRPTVAGRLEPDHDPVVVRRGDTLWALAAAHLGRSADDASTARAVDRWHAANADVIGSDPDLIHPGQRLTPPKDRS